MKGNGSRRIQEELLSFLSRPGSFPEKPAAVEICQTHISLVAIAPPNVYKIKKPLNLGFLDYSTLENRRNCCQSEVRLNRRLSHNVYLGVVSIARLSGALCFVDEDDEGEVIEYAVKMRQLPREGFLDRRLAENTFTDDDLGRVVARLGSFYRAQESSDEIAEWGRITKLQLSTDENFEQTERFVGELFSRPAFEAIRYFTGRFCERCASLLELRRTGGHILDCHGDLRCEHIHFSGEEVNIFDCIEFNERFRFIDVANDLAFLAMDFDFLGRPELGASFLHRMANDLRDPDLLALTDFYKCYRAYVRGKVEAIKSVDLEVPAAERQRSGENAVRYFQLALAYATSGSEPFVLVIMGRVASGKSTVARVLSEALGWPVFSSDRTRKELAGVALFERGMADARAELYQGSMTCRTYDILVHRVIERAAKYKSSILDATFGKRQQRAALRQVLTAGAVRFCVVEITASDEEVIDRLRRRADSKEEISDARLEDFEMLTGNYETPALDEKHVSIASRSDPESTITEVLKALIAR